jgi:acetylglutamate kinase
MGPDRAIRAPKEDIVGVDDIVNKGKQMFEQNRDKIEEALKSEQAEDVSDKLLAGAADAIKKVVPEEHHAQVDETREAIDKHIGNQ